MKLSLLIFSLFLSFSASFAEESPKLRELLNQKEFSQKQESLLFSILGENVQEPSIISKFIVNEFNNKKSPEDALWCMNAANALANEVFSNKENQYHNYQWYVNLYRALYKPVSSSGTRSQFKFSYKASKEPRLDIDSFQLFVQQYRAGLIKFMEKGFQYPQFICDYYQTICELVSEQKNASAIKLSYFKKIFKQVNVFLENGQLSRYALSRLEKSFFIAINFTLEELEAKECREVISFFEESKSGTKFITKFKTSLTKFCFEMPADLLATATKICSDTNAPHHMICKIAKLTHKLEIDLDFSTLLVKIVQSRLNEPSNSEDYESWMVSSFTHLNSKYKTKTFKTLLNLPSGVNRGNYFNFRQALTTISVKENYNTESVKIPEQKSPSLEEIIKKKNLLYERAVQWLEFESKFKNSTLCQNLENFNPEKIKDSIHSSLKEIVTILREDGGKQYKLPSFKHEPFGVKFLQKLYHANSAEEVYLFLDDYLIQIKEQPKDWQVDLIMSVFGITATTEYPSYIWQSKSAFYAYACKFFLETKGDYLDYLVQQPYTNNNETLTIAASVLYREKLDQLSLLLELKYPRSEKLFQSVWNNLYKFNKTPSELVVNLQGLLRVETPRLSEFLLQRSFVIAEDDIYEGNKIVGAICKNYGYYKNIRGYRRREYHKKRAQEIVDFFTYSHFSPELLKQISFPFVVDRCGWSAVVPEITTIINGKFNGKESLRMLYQALYTRNRVWDREQIEIVSSFEDDIVNFLTDSTVPLTTKQLSIMVYSENIDNFNRFPQLHFLICKTVFSLKESPYFNEAFSRCLGSLIIFNGEQTQINELAKIVVDKIQEPELNKLLGSYTFADRAIYIGCCMLAGKSEQVKKLLTDEALTKSSIYFCFVQLGLVDQAVELFVANFDKIESTSIYLRSSRFRIVKRDNIDRFINAFEVGDRYQVVAKIYRDHAFRVFNKSQPELKQLAQLKSVSDLKFLDVAIFIGSGSFDYKDVQQWRPDLYKLFLENDDLMNNSPFTYLNTLIPSVKQLSKKEISDYSKQLAELLNKRSYTFELVDDQFNRGFFCFLDENSGDKYVDFVTNFLIESSKISQQSINPCRETICHCLGYLYHNNKKKELEKFVKILSLKKLQDIKRYHLKFKGRSLLAINLAITLKEKKND